MPAPGDPTPWSPGATPVLAAVLLTLAAFLSSLGGEAQAETILPWLAVLSAMTLVWLATLAAAPPSPRLLLFTAAAMRILFLGMASGYDIFRYVWEGRILAAGFNPYLHPPQDPLLTALRDEVWTSVGHPAATAIYPPLTEVLFAAFTTLGLGVFAFKVVFALADLALCALLLRRFGARAAVVYAWNPLAAASFAGGGHYDSLFMLSLALAWVASDNTNARPFSAPLWTGIAIGLKWMALPLGLWLVLSRWRGHGLARGWATALWVAVPTTVSWCLVSAWTGEATLQLTPPDFTREARSAEALPYLADLLFTQGPLDNRWFLAAMLLAWIAVAWRAKGFLQAAEGSFAATYLISPMLHAWYFPWMLPLAAPSRHPAFIALCASGLLYFPVVHRLAQPGGTWSFSWWERALIWGPFLIGFVIRRAGWPLASRHPRPPETR